MKKSTVQFISCILFILAGVIYFLKTDYDGNKDMWYDLLPGILFILAGVFSFIPYNRLRKKERME